MNPAESPRAWVSHAVSMGTSAAIASAAGSQGRAGSRLARNSGGSPPPTDDSRASMKASSRSLTHDASRSVGSSLAPLTIAPRTTTA